MNDLNNLATIEQIAEIFPHSNAERLEISKVRGYNIIVPKDKYKVGDVVVLIHPDVILPERPWAESFKKYAPKRVRAIKIRSEFSFGIVIPIEDVFGGGMSFGEANIGQEVGELIGVSKYEAPQPQELNAKGNLPYGIFKTDESRFQGLKNIPYGELANITVKWDGCLDAKTLIDTERGQLSIEYIVENNMVGLKVVTLNTLTGEVENQEILSTAVADNNGKEWFELETENGTILRLTENHMVFLPELGCYRRADQLKDGDEIIMLS